MAGWIVIASSRTRGAKPWAAKCASQARRVPEPRSRTMKRSSARSASAIRRRCAQRCDADAITTSGLGRKACFSSSMSCGGIDMTSGRWDTRDHNHSWYYWNGHRLSLGALG